MGRAAFRMQMETLAAANAPVVSLRQVENWLAGEGAELPIGAIAITFDDAFQDFEVEALPVLTSYGFATAVFAPALCVGGVESWRGADEPPRPLMDWAAIERAQAAGVTIGSHALTHPDLTSLDDAQLEEEVALSRDMLERRLGAEVRYFAPPYGRSNQKVRAALARHYRLSFGVRLGEAGRDAARFDLPRVEMHYFRDPARWRDFVGGEKRYLAARQALRAVKNGAESAARRLRRRG
jgi:peptidoglycan/xylan/chitin deacetylase (PgdA/CDA1 family)